MIDTIRIAGTEFSLKNKSFEIYIQGCYRRCSGCHNPDTQPFDGGKVVNIVSFCRGVANLIKPFGSLVENIYVTGGDLLCQTEGVAKTFSLTLFLLFTGRYNMWLFTGEEEILLPNWIWEYYDVVKCGKYREDLLNPVGTFPASKNQKLLFNKKFKEQLEPLFLNVKFMGDKKWK